MSQLASSAGPSSRDRWMGLLAAFLGWMFDGLEMGIFPIVARPALRSMLGVPGAILTPEQAKLLEGEVGAWNGYIVAFFLIGAATGGFVFGWLGDRIGRVRAMALSILAYSVFSGLCYFAQTPLQLGLLRFLSALGMGGEWSLGVALVMELWDGKHRWMLAAAIGSAVNLGFALISAITIYGFSVTETSWRWVMLIGAVPALLTFFIRLFVPESHHWTAVVKKAEDDGTVRKPLAEIFQPPLLKATIIAIVLATIPQIGTWGSISNVTNWVGVLVDDNAKPVAQTPPKSEPATQPDPAVQANSDTPAKPASVPLFSSAPQAKSYAQLCSSIGSIFGCIFGTWLAQAASRRIAYFGLCLASLAITQYFFRLTVFDTHFMVVLFFVGFFASSFFGWLPLYLPELFPTRVRATGQGVGYNSARILSAAGSFYMGTFVGKWGWAQTSGTVAFVYGLGLLAIWFAPETKDKPLPE